MKSRASGRIGTTASLNKTPISYKANRKIGGDAPSRYVPRLQGEKEVALNDSKMPPRATPSRRPLRPISGPAASLRVIFHTVAAQTPRWRPSIPKGYTEITRSRLEHLT